MKFQPHILHKVAVFFNPKQKSMKVLSDDDRASVLEYVTDQMDALPLRLPPQISAGTAPPQAKRKRVSAIDKFDDEPTVVEKSEIELYRDNTIQGVTDILSWWKSHRVDFPFLNIIARNVMCVMATSAASERNFIVAGNVVSNRRSCLKSSCVNDILFMNSALK